MVRTRVTRHDTGRDDDVVVALELAVRVVRRLDRPREQRVLGRVDRADGCRLECRVPSVADSEGAIRRCILARELLAKRSIRQVEVLCEALEQRRIVLLRGINRTTISTFASATMLPPRSFK